MEKEIKYYNTDLISSIAIHNKREATYFDWEEEYVYHIFMFIPVGRRKAGFYHIDYREVLTHEQITSGKLRGVKYVIEWPKVYFRPYVEIQFISGEKKIEKFDTYGQALARGHELRDRHLPNNIKEITYD